VPIMTMSSAIEIVSRTNPGKVRSHNEDFVAHENETGVVLLADGMGGYNAGEVASGMAAGIIVEGLGRTWRALTSDKRVLSESASAAGNAIQEQVERANWAIFEKAQNEPQCAGMGTTLVVGLFYDNQLTVGHIGDSRMYRLRGESLDQITKDHSLLQEQVDGGLISKEDARKSRNKNLLTRALGIDPKVEAEIRSFDVLPGDTYLLCSDGLNDMVDDEEIRLTLLTLQSNLALAGEQLVLAANDNGGRDNISVVLVKVLQAFPATRGWLARLKSWFSSRGN
jgi:PPM family protein phosphatase